MNISYMFEMKSSADQFNFFLALSDILNILNNLDTWECALNKLIDVIIIVINKFN
jgi:hypothetical protein